MYWFVHLGTITELNGWDAMSPGHLDQHLAPFYEKELEENTLTREQAKELLACLWIKINNQPAPPKVGVTAKESGTYNDFTQINLGGLLKNGRDGTNEVSYIALGISLGNPLAIMGGMVHLVHQGLMKITLFFCAGNIAETLGVHDISRMNGVGRRLPLTMGAFTLAAMGMIGLPPMAGFVSKWYLGLGALDHGHGWLIVVLVLSTLFNAAYFLPILYCAWFKEQEERWPDDSGLVGSLESHWMLIAPPVVTAIIALLVGLLANSDLSPLTWVRFIVSAEYGL